MENRGPQDAGLSKKTTKRQKIYISRRSRYMGASKNMGKPQIIHLFIGFSNIFKPSILGGFTPILGNIHI